MVYVALSMFGWEEKEREGERERAERERKRERAERGRKTVRRETYEKIKLGKKRDMH